jgi:lipoate-protein ligase A
MSWFVLNSGRGEPAVNMATDEALLIHATETGAPLLRFYGWTEPAATFGYFQKHAEIERATQLRPLIRRPTGGGLVPHLADWTYSLVVPPRHEWYRLRAEESYRRMHLWIQSALKRVQIESELAGCCRKEMPGQCFVGYEKHDVLSHGRKIAGAAQRRNKCGLLIQGSIQPVPAGVDLPTFVEAMSESGIELFGGGCTGADVTKLIPYIQELAKTRYAITAHNRRR